MVAQLQSSRIDGKTAYSDALSVGRKTAALSDQNNTAPDFAGTLVQVLNSQGGSGQENGVLPANLGNELSGLLFAFIPQATDHAAESGQDALSALLDLLQSDDPTALQLLLQNPQFAGWLAEVALVLQQLNTNPLPMQGNLTGDRLSASAGLPVGGAVNGSLPLQTVIQLLKQLQSAIAQTPQDGKIQALLAKLQDMHLADAVLGMQEDKVGGSAGMQKTSAGHPVQSVFEAKRQGHNAQSAVNPVYMAKTLSYHPDINGKNGNGATGEKTQLLSGEAQSEATVGNAVSVSVLEWGKGTIPSFANKEMPPIPADRFAQEMSRFLLKSMKISSLNGISQAKISLYPEHLGQVEVKITVHNGMVVAQFLTDTAKAKEMIESQLAQLRSTLHNQGLQVDKLEVAQNHQAYSGMFHDQRQQRSTERFFQKVQNRQKYDDDLMAFSAELDHAAQIKNLVAGSSFHATA